VATNELTIEAVDPKSGTSEFKAAAVRVELVEKQDTGRLHAETVSGAKPESPPAVLEPVSS
jgi:hypothetical protein